MDTIQITSARLHRKGVRPETVKLSITIPSDSLSQARKMIAEEFHADEIYLMYETTSSTNGSQPVTKT